MSPRAVHPGSRSNGGWVDRDERRRRTLGPDHGKVDTFVSYVVPEAAL